MDIKTIPYYTFAIALLSLIFSTILAILRILEYRRDNAKIAVSYAITGDPNGHNSIYLTNLSSTPILIDYWELVWKQKKWLFFNSYKPINLFSDEDLHVTLPSRVRHSLDFKDEYSFNWHPKAKGKIKLYIVLHISGKNRTKYLFVYKPYY